MNRSAIILNAALILASIHTILNKSLSPARHFYFVKKSEPPVVPWSPHLGTRLRLFGWLATRTSFLTWPEIPLISTPRIDRWRSWRLQASTSDKCTMVIKVEKKLKPLLRHRWNRGAGIHLGTSQELQRLGDRAVPHFDHLMSVLGKLPYRQ